MYAAINKTDVTGVYRSRMSAGKAKVILSTLVKVDTEMTEPQLTQVANHLTGNTTKRIRGKDKALKIINAAFFAKEQDEKPTAKAAKDVTQPPAMSRRVGVKARVRAVFDAVTKVDPPEYMPKYTVAQLCVATGGTEVSVRTALSDLKAVKYAGIEGPLNIVKNDKKEYYIANHETA